MLLATILSEAVRAISKVSAMSNPVYVADREAAGAECG